MFPQPSNRPTVQPSNRDSRNDICNIFKRTITASGYLKSGNGGLFLRILILSVCVFFTSYAVLNAQPPCNDCKPTGGPTYKCISGAVSDLIISGDLLDINDAQTTPQYVVIAGDVRIDMDYAFTNGSILIVLHDKEIRVKETFELRIEDSEIRGCEYMWDGILLENQAKLSINNSLIRDAKHAIHLHSGVDEYVELSVVNSEFRANYVALNLSLRMYPNNNLDNLVAIHREEGIVSTDFYLNDLLLPDFTSQITDEYPKIGIYIKDILEMEIGGSTIFNGAVNSIIGIGPCPSFDCEDDPEQFGIIVRRTNTIIRNTKIEDIIYAVSGIGGTSLPIKGITYEGLGTVGGTGGGDPISMDNIRIAFDIKGMGLITSGSKIQQGGLGTSVLINLDSESESFNMYYYKTKISDNLIFNASLPTIQLLSYGTNNGLISNNNIDITNVAYDGRVISSTFPSIRKNDLSIYQNNISLPSTGSTGYFFVGISLNNHEGTYIARNVIDGSSIYNNGNIYLGFCEKIGVFKNYISPTLELQSTNAYGIRAFETRNSTYACNIASNLNVGMQFSGDCMYSDVQKNRMEYDKLGLNLTNQFNTKIGAQPDRRNRWPGTNSYSGGYEVISQSPSDESKFYVPQATNSDYWPDPYTPVDLFVNSSGPTGYPDLLQCQDTFYYDHEPHGPVDVGIGGNFVDPDDELITGIYNPDSIYGAALIRDAEYQLYNKMKNYPTLISTSIASEAWYDSMEISNLGVIYDVDQTLRTIGTLFGEDEDEFLNFQDSIDLLEEYIQDLHYTINNETDSLVRASLILDREQATLDLIDLNTRSNDFYDVWYADKMIEASNALEDINGITPLNTWETNFAIFLRIQLESTITETWPELSSNQMDSLEIVANQCRYSGGVPVIRARAITMGPEGFEVDEDEYCEPRSTSNFDQLSGINFPLLIYPNPATSSVNINLPKEKGIFRLVVRDMLGKKYHDLYFQGTGESTYLLPLDHLNTGMYNILLYSPNSKMYSTILSTH